MITTNTKLYLILELGSGGDLLDYLNKMPHGLGEERSRDYFSQIIRAIAYCHHLHIVHRWVKDVCYWVIVQKRQGAFIVQRLYTATEFDFVEVYMWVCL